MVVCRVRCLSMYMVVSRKFAVVCQYSNVNLIVGWNELVLSMNSLRLSSVSVQMKKMSSMNLFHRAIHSV